MKIGVFGGSFNPPHMGHINAVQTAARKLGLSKVIIVPNFQNPIKNEVEGPTPAQRFEMLQVTKSDWGVEVILDDREIKRGGQSYTVDTLAELKKEHANDELFFIMGSDAFEQFDKWKSPDQILELSNLIVTSRPGFDFPASKTDLPKKVQKLVADFDFNFVELKTEKSVQFLKLTDVDLSSSQIRKWLRIGKKAEKHIPLSVENYIQEKGLYRLLNDRIGDFKKFAEFCGKQLDDKKGIAVRAFDLRKMSAPTEFAVVSSGTSTKHTSSLAENLVRSIKEEYGVAPLRMDGKEEGRWVVLDYGSLMVHLFYDYVRNEYAIENLWRGAEELKIQKTPNT